MNREIKTTCPYCGVGCGITAEVSVDGRVQITGDENHPANTGRLCSKGASLADTLNLKNRLEYPLYRGDRIDWDLALDLMAERFSATIREHGPEAVAFYVSGQLLTEDYYVANKLMKGFIGSGNIDTNSRLCMSSSVAGYKRAFGSDTVPCCYEDLEQADLLVLVGSNMAWCHPVLFRRIRESKKHNSLQRVVVIDPRVTATCDIADLHLQLKPGTDIALFNGLLNFLQDKKCLDQVFIESHTNGFDRVTALLRDGTYDINSVAERTGLTSERVEQFYTLFASTKKTVTTFSQGVNQWSCGTDKVNAIINCHLATGRIGKPGTGPFSLTGQPNAMGGREVGGLANQLAAHMDFQPEAIERVRTFWDATNIAQQPGLKAVEMFDAIERGQIKAIWVMATNPAVSLPDADRVRRVLQQCEWVVLSDCVMDTDTARCADLLLPATTWGEKEGTVTNSDRRISRQRRFVEPPEEARDDWWIITQLARRLGYTETFDYQSPAQIFREHAALSGFDNAGRRDFDISGLSGMSDQEYDAFQPVQWPISKEDIEGRARLFENGRFYHGDHRACFLATSEVDFSADATDDYPLLLNTGRVRDQWHTMTRTGNAPLLNRHISEPLISIHPEQAETYGLNDGDFVRVESRFGEMIVKADVTHDLLPGSLFAPMHWSDSQSSRCRVDALVNPLLDPVSGQPQFKQTPVRFTPWRFKWRGFLLSRDVCDLPGAEYCVAIREAGFWRYEIAGNQAIDHPEIWARGVLGETGEWIDFLDSFSHHYRGARIIDGRLDGTLFLTTDGSHPGHEWLGRLFQQEILETSDRNNLLAGKPLNGGLEQGKIICACFNVGLNTLVEVIKSQQLTSVDAIGEALKAGTNCGSCIPELRNLLDV